MTSLFPASAFFTLKKNSEPCPQNLIPPVKNISPFLVMTDWMKNVESELSLSFSKFSLYLTAALYVSIIWMYVLSEKPLV